MSGGGQLQVIASRVVRVSVCRGAVLVPLCIQRCYEAHVTKLWADDQGWNSAIQGVQVWMILSFMYSLSR